MIHLSQMSTGINGLCELFSFLKSYNIADIKYKKCTSVKFFSFEVTIMASNLIRNKFCEMVFVVYATRLLFECYYWCLTHFNLGLFYISGVKVMLINNKDKRMESLLFLGVYNWWPNALYCDRSYTFRGYNVLITFQSVPVNIYTKTYRLWRYRLKTFCLSQFVALQARNHMGSFETLLL